MAKRETIQLSNGMFFDPNTGSVWLPGEEPNSYDYRYDAELGKTFFNGQEYSGRFDPFILSSITEDDQNNAANYYQGWLDKKFTSLEHNPFIVGSEAEQYGDAYIDRQFGDAVNPIFSTYNNYLLGHAYDAARKRYEGSTVFDELDSYRSSLDEQDAQERAQKAEIDRKESEYQSELNKIKSQYQHPGTQKIYVDMLNERYGKSNNSPISEGQEANGMVFKNGAWVPPAETISQVYDREQSLRKSPGFEDQIHAANAKNAGLPTPPSTFQPTNTAAQAGFEELDWKGLYDNLAGIVNSYSQQPKKPREQLANYYDYGPNVASRQNFSNQKYGTTYSGKGA